MTNNSKFKFSDTSSCIFLVFTQRTVLKVMPGQKACEDLDSNDNKIEFLHQVTRQLFEPLVMQLIHWFTNNKKFESQDTVAVLEAIMVRVHTEKAFSYYASINFTLEKKKPVSLPSAICSMCVRC